MYNNAKFSAEAIEWVDQQFANLTTDLDVRLPSEVIEEKRYLPPSVTDQPGYYSFEITPFWREPLDCLSPLSPIRFLDVMKGVQTGYTVGVLENGLFYLIEHIKSDPVMFMTADKELSKLRLDTYIMPMLDHSNIDHLIQSSELNNPRKTGKTSIKLSWVGGGFCVFIGANNPTKAASTSIKDLFIDEWDKFPIYMGKEGRPGNLAEDRTANYEESRKVIRGGTPLIEQTSETYKAFMSGDQRYYNIPCKHCGSLQRLRFDGKNTKGEKYGLIWELEGQGRLVEGSVRYVCQVCQAEMVNDDKAQFLRENRPNMATIGGDAGPWALWAPTATPDRSSHRSYQISALYSPVGFQSWEEQVQKWLKAWDIENNRPRDMALLQQFYNNVLGWPFKMIGESLRLEQVQQHRRTFYHIGQVPNKAATDQAGGPVQLLTAAIDIHKHHVDHQVMGFAPGGRFYSVDYAKIECDDGENRQDPVWNKIEDLLENKRYESDDDRIYRIETTLIDASYATDTVYDFCSQYALGVFPIMGRELPPKSATFKHFAEYESKLGTRCYNITVGLYKDRLAQALRREWSGMGRQPIGHPNFPQEYPDKFFKELRAETKNAVKDARTGEVRAFIWSCPPNADNHAWDLTVYNLAALDMLALNICEIHLGLDHIDWEAFWELCEKQALFWDPA